MNRDTTIVQVAILLIAIAILGTAIYNQQNKTKTKDTTKPIITQVVQEAMVNTWKTTSGSTIIASNPVKERENSYQTKLVKEYFAHMEAKEYKKACWLLSTSKCASIREAAVEAFSQEHQKYLNGYEYIAIKDLWLKSPSGKDIVCVKYSYRLKNEQNPKLVSEILSFYIEEDVGRYSISDRVCEKKYKDGSWERPCPVQANQNFCVWKIR